MTLFIEAFLWCAVQVTLFAFCAVAVYLLVVRWATGLGAAVLLGSLAVVGALTILMLAPAPRWEWNRPTSQPAFPETDLAANDVPADDLGEVFSFDETFLDDSASTGTTEPLPIHVDASSIATEIAIPDDLRAESVDEIKESKNAVVSTDGPLHAVANLPWRLIVTALAGLAVAAGVIRMAIALFALQRYRRNSMRLADTSLEESAAAISRRLGLRRPARLCESSAVSTPATIGWWRPIVLLPPDWREWSSEERAAVLAHELAHVQLGHFAQWLFSQWVLVPHYYHPLVHWLVRRLRVEQELAADEHAARAVGDHQQYAAALAALALRPAVVPPGGATLGLFMSHSLLMRRIKMLGSTSPNAVSSKSRAQLIVILLMLGLGVAVAGIRGNRVVAQEAAETADVVVEEDVEVEVSEVEPEVTVDVEVAADVEVEEDLLDKIRAEHDILTLTIANEAETEGRFEATESADEASDADHTENPGANSSNGPEMWLLKAELERLRFNLEKQLQQIAAVESRIAKFAQPSAEELANAVKIVVGDELPKGADKAPVQPVFAAEARYVSQIRALEEQLRALKQAQQPQMQSQLERARQMQDLARQRERFGTQLSVDRSRSGERPTHQVTALLRIQHDDPNTMSVVRETQLALLNSEFVLEAAVREQKLKELEVIANEPDPVAWLRQNLDVSFIGNSEILQLHMECDEDKVDQYRKIVDAVARAFLDNVVNSARAQTLGTRDVMRRSLAKLKEEIRHKMEDHQDLAKELGALNGQNQLDQELMLRRMDRLETEIMRLENEALLHGMQGDESKESQVKQSYYAERMKQLAQKRAELAEEMKARVQPSVELNIRQTELEQLSEVARQLGMKIEQADIQMEQQRPPVQLIQQATASRIDGHSDSRGPSPAGLR